MPLHPLRESHAHLRVSTLQSHQVGIILMKKIPQLCIKSNFYDDIERREAKNLSNETLYPCMSHSCRGWKEAASAN